MSFVISSYIPFPNIYWWLKLSENRLLYLDSAEHFQKMSYRNRYYISGANGLIQLSIPLAHGRNQRCPVREVQISNKENWQVQHWRTLVSVYGRTPFFEHYEPTLKQLFDKDFTFLIDFNLASIHWLMQQLNPGTELRIADEYIKNYGAGVTDLRTTMKPGMEKVPAAEAAYYQIFADRTGFLPNLSMLDLLFSEGPYALQWIKTHREAVQGWGETPV